MLVQPLIEAAVIERNSVNKKLHLEVQFNNRQYIDLISKNVMLIVFAL